MARAIDVRDLFAAPDDDTAALAPMPAHGGAPAAPAREDQASDRGEPLLPQPGTGAGDERRIAEESAPRHEILISWVIVLLLLVGIAASSLLVAHRRETTGAPGWIRHGSAGLVTPSTWSRDELAAPWGRDEE